MFPSLTRLQDILSLLLASSALGAYFLFLQCGPQVNTGKVTAHPRPIASPDTLLFPHSVETLDPRAPLANGSPLRIMVLGASIMSGESTSSDGNGMRRTLREALRARGNEVNMVGSLQTGTMLDNDNEAHSGFLINQVIDAVDATLPAKPNLVLLQCGSNDAFANYQTDTAVNRTNTLLDKIYAAVPNAYIVIANYYPNPNADFEARMSKMSTQLAAMVAERKNRYKQRIQFVNLRSSSFQASDLRSDGTHPTDEGYIKQAALFYNAIVQINTDIAAPATVKGVDDGAAKDGVHSTSSKVMSSAQAVQDLRVGAGVPSWWD
jgi:lysophospholipase L1-like esterase